MGNRLIIQVPSSNNQRIEKQDLIFSPLFLGMSLTTFAITGIIFFKRFYKKTKKQEISKSILILKIIMPISGVVMRTIININMI